MSKPREFWIDKNVRNTCMTTVVDFECEGKLHVIEKSAFDQLQAENEKLKERIEKLNRENNEIKMQSDFLSYDELDHRYKELQKRYEKLKGAAQDVVDRIDDRNTTYCEDFCTHDLEQALGEG